MKESIQCHTSFSQLGHKQMSCLSEDKNLPKDRRENIIEKGGGGGGGGWM